MLDTVIAGRPPFLMTRFLSSDLKLYAVCDGGDTVLYRDIHKANYNDFKYHCLSKSPTGKILNILHATININGRSELHQYVIWRCFVGNFLAATLLTGNENFEIKR